MTNLEIYRNVFMETFGVAGDVLNDTFTFERVEQWDSLAHMELIGKLEEAFGVFFQTEDILNYGSYLNGMEILRRYGVDI